MQRGGVYLCDIELPNRTTRPTSSQFQNRRKLLIVLQEGAAVAAPVTEVGVVIASTWRRNNARPFEVILGIRDGFEHDTVVDGRWVYTVPQSTITNGSLKFTLPSVTMHAISLAIVKGLQLR